MRYPFPIPYGWFCIGYSHELAAGEVKPLRYFGQDLVLFRTDGGAAAVLDAYCPHLGAHLGHGGKVAGESVVCPFHAWAFDGRGVCTDVPYANQIPPRIQGKSVLHSYPVSEVNGLIWCWYHPRRVAPLFEVEHVAEMDSDDWTPLDCYEWTIRSIIQETGENAVDTAHFLYVHTAATLPEGEITVEGHRRVTDITMMTPALDENGVRDPTGKQLVHGHLVTRNCGPGQTVQYFNTFFRTIMIGTITPIDAEHIHLRFSFSQPRAATPEQQAMARGVIANVVQQVGQDIPIWEHKKYQENPILCDSDGPINKYRKWFRQFYDELGQDGRNTAAA